MTKRKITLDNYNDSDNNNINQGNKDGINLYNLMKHDKSFDLKSYLDGFINGYTIERGDNILVESSIKKSKIIHAFNITTFIESLKNNYNQGNSDGIIFSKATKSNIFFELKKYLDGFCNGYINLSCNPKEKSHVSLTDCLMVASIIYC